LSIYAVIVLLGLFVYSSLLILMLRDRKTRLRRQFSVYLGVAAVWSLATLFLSVDLLGQTRAWAGLVVLSGATAMIAYYSFVCGFVEKGGGLPLKVGYGAVLFALVPLVGLGYIPVSVGVTPEGVDIYYGALLYLVAGVTAPFFVLSLYRLVSRYRSLHDPLERNKVIYLLSGLGVLMAFGVWTAVPPMPRYPIEHIGHLGNAMLISYAITKYKLLDVKLVLRKGLVYSSITIFITAMFLVMLLALHYFVQSWNSSASYGGAFVLAFVMAWMFNPLRSLLQRTVDRIFYGESYDYREMVHSFAQRMSNVLDLGELAEAMLKPIARAVGASQVSLLLPSDGDYVSQFAERLEGEEQFVPIRLAKDSPIVAWLSENNGVLAQEMIDGAPEFKGIWEAEKHSIEAAELELLLPMKSKGNLIGVLALSKKPAGGPYSGDDLDLLSTLVNEASVVIENAQLYAQARERAHIDELTGLYNHRYFHERLDEEISRCSRFGDIFSLLFLDLDLFKTYNDVYGHLAGDKILKELVQHIVNSVRSIDMVFRYGGDEFTVILPQASVDDAQLVAERVRKRIESEMDSRGVALTCSLGIASWPTDGVMREELLKAADAALYHSKQTGRNRIVRACDMAPQRVPKMGGKVEAETGVLSTIYALAATVDAKDHYTYGHSKKVSKYATEIAEALGYSEDRIATVRAAGLLHDIGKIGVSDGVLLKTNKLSEDDWEAIRAHPNLGVAILKHVEGLNGCLAAIQYHHERYDGGGYPAGLKGHNIPLDARILGVADAYDAMTSLRPYREGKFSTRQALDELNRCAGSQFDAEIVKVFVSLYEGTDAGGGESERSPAEVG
jgi:diguanylate cyclase (GGDEF)-like protein/putative nucleotidyltransferase with HDIG domain